ncbi:uncharacterized protein LOC103311953 [Acyrthosiphon pisum]|uniref:Integrase catalytic domain-containing protein n=1 Tax=Acyrthosiphon pisum TaxID=7029 RepID=A0A8R2BBS7_ACYPI|nr:uncharacterized protein LOC103311953 [Acyrthosiphon pisum]|eukprot:XP_008190090.1 PREDICTED: uncharacterized protein LOC103311953 [Acyrthosiphon pisum]
MSDEEIKTRNTRLKQRATAKRDLAASHIRRLHASAKAAGDDPTARGLIMTAGQDLNNWWSQYSVESDALLNVMVELDEIDQFSPDADADVYAMVVEIKSIINNYEQETLKSSKDARPVIQISDTAIMANPSEDHQSITQTSNAAILPNTASVMETQSSARVSSSPSSDVSFRPQVSMRLPKIPLPKFDGDLHSTRFYYLLGCLEADAGEVLKGIPVSKDTFQLAWNTLVKSYDKPRKLASSIIESFLVAPVSTSESLVDLKRFLSVFDEGLAILESLHLPDLCSFLLFIIASKSLPTHTRRLFESDNSAEYPSVDSVLEFVKNRVRVLENAGGTSGPGKSFGGSNKKPNPGPGKHYNRPSTTQTALVSFVKTQKPKSTDSEKCRCCGGAHALKDCAKFLGASVDDRYHDLTDYVCVCKRRHHGLLHKDPSTSDPSSKVPKVAMFAKHQNQLPSVVLATALLHVQDVAGSPQTVRALIDGGSQISAISANCCQRLGLRAAKWTLPVTGLSELPVPSVLGIVDLHIQPRDSSQSSMPVRAWVLSSITSDMPTSKLPSTVREKCGDLSLADPLFDIPAPVEILLGADIYPMVWSHETVSLGHGYPTAFNSIFGWAIVGPLQHIKAPSPRALPVQISSSVESLMEKFWNVEEPEAAPPVFTQEGQCEEIFLSEMCKNGKGQYMVPLPFRDGQPSSFPGMRQIAVNRLLQLERKLSRDPVLYNNYRRFMVEYESLGHMSEADSPGDYYIPHHAVYKAEGENMKLRVVFDASARCRSGSSLNEGLHVGPKLQQDIVDVLTGFRVHTVAFTTDICKMYRQIWVLEKYRGYQHILWRSSPQLQIRENTLNTVTYGVNSAPYLALRVLRHIADNDCEEVPEVSKALKFQTYMDDICVGAPSLECALSLKSDLIKTLSRSGLMLKKWSSNEPRLLSGLPLEDLAGDPLTFDRGDGIPVLGMQWRPTADHFVYDITAIKSVLSKRGVLSVIARIFDPLGFLSPVIFHAKCIMQRLWSAQTSWDEPLPPAIAKEWQQFLDMLGWLTEIRIPRCIGGSIGIEYSLCGFCDASERGYAAVLYLRVTDPSQKVNVYLLGAKTKLTSLKPTTIPRLELCGAVLLASWLSRMHRILEAHMKISGVYAWSDSTIVLSWLLNPHVALKVFVSNRVHHIKTLLPVCKWAHVRSEENPADCASRGLSPAELVKAQLYWSGPEFLRSPVDHWDLHPTTMPGDQLPEVHSVALLITTSIRKGEWFTRLSSYSIMIRVIARLRRFIGRCRRQETVSGNLTRSELDQALYVLVKCTQGCLLSSLLRELSSGSAVSSKVYAKLSPFIDEFGVIRVGGRLQNAMCSWDRKHPILLPKESHLSALIARHWHLSACHARSNLLMSLVNSRFWIMGVRRVVYKAIKSCITCVKLDGVNPQPKMADLPVSRVQACRAFTAVGIDYAGPLMMKETKLRKAREYKVYIALFVCMSTRAIHLEVVLDLSTDAFLAALDRFVVRRGVPTSIHSDCGTNFVGAARKLRELINSPSSRDQCSSRLMCHWNFNPPSAPHFGGLWEAAVKSTKSLLTRSLGAQTWTLEEFTTILCRVEAALNSRPLTPVTSDPEDLDCLTPGHFLIGQPLMSVPEEELSVKPVNIQRRWKLLQQTFQTFWRRWSSEYLNTLQARIRWSSSQENVKVGDMVVIKDNTAPPLL